MRNPFQGSAWPNLPHWPFHYTGTTLESLKVIMGFRCPTSCSNTTIYLNLVLQGRHPCPLGFAFPAQSKHFSGITFATPCNSTMNGSYSQTVCVVKLFVRSLACSATAPQTTRALCRQLSYSGDERVSRGQEQYGCGQILPVGLRGQLASRLWHFWDI